MKNRISVNVIVIVIGLLSIVSGLYLGIAKGMVNEAVYGISIGLTLFGTAFFNIDKWIEKDTSEVE